MSTVNAGWRGPNIVKEGLVLYLDAASGTSYSPYTSGNTWRDISGNGNNGTVNGATLTDDRNGNSGSAYYFDGNDLIDCANPTSLGDNPVATTYSFWLYVDTIQVRTCVDYPIISKRHSNNGYDWCSVIYRWDDFNLHFFKDAGKRYSS